MRQLPIMGGWYFCAFAVSTYDGAEISTQKGHKSDALALLATMVLVLRSSHIDEAGILQASKQSRLYLIYFPNSLTAGIPAEKDKTAF